MSYFVSAGRKMPRPYGMCTLFSLFSSDFFLSSLLLVAHLEFVQHLYFLKTEEATPYIAPSLDNGFDKIKMPRRSTAAKVAAGKMYDCRRRRIICRSRTIKLVFLPVRLQGEKVYVMLKLPVSFQEVVFCLPNSFFPGVVRQTIFFLDALKKRTPYP